MRIGEALHDGTLTKLVQTSWTHKKVAKLSSMNWTPAAMTNYLMHETRLDEKHAQKIVNTVLAI